MWCFSEPFSTQENFDRKRLSDSQIRRNKLWSRVAVANFFLWTGPVAQTAQKQTSRTTKSALMKDWLFKLGCDLKGGNPRCHFWARHQCSIISFFFVNTWLIIINSKNSKLSLFGLAYFLAAHSNPEKQCKVHIFLGDHKILRNLHLTFDQSTHSQK